MDWEWSRFRKKLRRARLQRLWIRTASIAAAVGLLLGLGLWLSRPDQPEAPAYTIFTGDHITPGTTKATLRVDGKEIGLYAENNLRTEQRIVVTDTTGQVLFASATHRSSLPPRILSLEVGRAEVFDCTLPDGSRVWLNSGSRLEFPEFFEATQRTVSFYGEGYFEVVHSHDLPFVVLTDDFTVRVTGTGFNIRNYDNEDHAAVALVQGGVTVEDAAGKTISRLLPGNELDKNRTDDTFSLRTSNLRQITAWRNGEFYFDQQELSSIVRQLERWYDVEFRIDPALKGLRYSGTLSMRNNLGALIRILKNTNELECVQDPQGVLTLIPAPGGTVPESIRRPGSNS
ncbi:MAG: DUF4974 domain-containing protein [Rikenellaceae bacterium]|nr:DUF4974 domain-containing protein [Rikenellaceae bacterium]